MANPSPGQPRRRTFWTVECTLCGTVDYADSLKMAARVTEMHYATTKHSDCLSEAIARATIKVAIAPAIKRHFGCPPRGKL